MEKETPRIVTETQELFRLYSDKRTTWAEHAQEDKEFRLGRQWTDEQTRELEARGQAPIVVNRIHPAVETAKAFLTSKSPGFKIFPKEGSDRKTATAFTALLEHIWNRCDGNAELRQAVDDYYVVGMGVLLGYIDPMQDMGKGEVVVKSVDPLDVYIDPNSRDPFCSDASNIIISKLTTKVQAAQMVPMFEEQIKNATGDLFSDRPTTSGADNGELIFPEDTETKTEGLDNDEEIRWFERYTKTMTRRYRIYEQFSGREDVMTDEEFKGYVQRPAWIINGQVVTNQQKAMQAIQMLTKQYEMMMLQYQQQKESFAAGLGEDELAREQGFDGMQNSPRMPQMPQKPQIEQVTFMKLIQMQLIAVVIIPAWRITKTVIVGDELLYSLVLPTEHYPVVVMKNLDTRTPYPTSDVRMVKNLQKYINKTRSLIIAHATTSTNTKILLPEGSVDIVEFEKKWAQPGVAITVDMEFGVPVPVQPLPLPNELYQNEREAKNDIDHQLGIYEFMMGNPQNAPNTNSGMMNLDDFGKRKIRSKLDDIESALIKLARVLIPLMQELYTTEKIIRIIEPNGIESEYMINKRMYDQFGNVTETVSDISSGSYDIIVKAGSTLPSNRFAQLQLYVEAYEKGIIDRQEVLKKTDIFDAEGVLQRIDVIQRLTQQVQQSQEEIKGLKGDLQTREREVYHAKQELEVEKFKGSLDKIDNKAQASRQVYESRLKDAELEVKKSVAESKDAQQRQIQGITQ